MAAVGIGQPLALAKADLVLPSIAAFDIGTFTTTRTTNWRGPVGRQAATQTETDGEDVTWATASK
jgi:alpha,alpha-trehalose phosphorylase